MASNQKQTFIVELTEGKNRVIEDREHKSKAIVPIQIDSGNSVEVVQVDGGLITGLSEGKPICDSLVYTIKDTSTNLNITWILELKGTQNQKNAKHAVEQIVQSIQYMQQRVSYPQAEKYITDRDFVFAAVAGAPDKTLPVLNNSEIKTLCKTLRALSRRRKDIKDMFALFCYVRPNKKCKKAEVKGNKPPYDILCYRKNDGYIPYPSMLTQLLKRS
ncbi:hypothetical protein D3Z38_01360 [Clostridiales bacterium]|nr:hypothetical protein [Clostridiales bacterium]